ncbi:MAG: hypothetical protein WBA93_19760 [Microcoleaceae cyanobacterium]
MNAIDEARGKLLPVLNEEIVKSEEDETMIETEESVEATDS